MHNTELKSPKCIHSRQSQLQAPTPLKTVSNVVWKAVFLSKKMTAWSWETVVKIKISLPSLSNKKVSKCVATTKWCRQLDDREKWQWAAEKCNKWRKKKKTEEEDERARKNIHNPKSHPVLLLLNSSKKKQKARICRFEEMCALISQKGDVCCVILFFLHVISFCSIWCCLPVDVTQHNTHKTEHSTAQHSTIQLL